jgi:hypothetical protein
MKRRILLLLLSGAMLSPMLLPRAQTQRGQTVVRIRVENGQELDLYDESHVLVIGVSDYNRGWRRQPGERADVGEIARVLESQGFKTVTKLFDPGRKEFDDAVRQFIGRYGLRERNRLVIYFAGHGHTERLSDDRDLGYVVMRDAPLPDRDPENFFLASVSMDEINSHALRIKAKHALFVFDSCFSGTIFRSESDRRTPPAIASRTAGPVRQFITSGSAGQSVPDDSIFRRYFVRAFDKAEGDLNGDGFITGEELGKYLMGTVADDSRDTQTPRYGKIKDAKLSIGDLVFALPKKAPPTPPPAPTPVFDPASLELELWRSADRANEISEFEEYLRQYPQGRYAVSARNRIARLRAAANAVPPPPAPSARMSVAGVPLAALAPFTTVKVDASGKITDRRANQESWGYVEDLGNGVKLEMVEIAPGEFLMGEDAAGAADYEKECTRYFDKDSCARWAKQQTPQHRVRLTGFLMSRYELTQRQWIAVMGGLPPNMSGLGTEFKGDDLPVVQVSWEEAQEFITASFRAAVGSAAPSAAGRRFATTARPAAGATASGSAS